MIWAFIIRHNRAFIAVGLLLAVVLALRWYVVGEVDQARQADAVTAMKADAKADDLAGRVAASEAATVEKENDDARKAAHAGNDPLADGLNSLRKGKTSGRPASP